MLLKISFSWHQFCWSIAFLHSAEGKRLPLQYCLKCICELFESLKQGNVSFSLLSQGSDASVIVAARQLPIPPPGSCLLSAQRTAGNYFKSGTGLSYFLIIFHNQSSKLLSCPNCSWQSSAGSFVNLASTDIPSSKSNLPLTTTW